MDNVRVITARDTHRLRKKQTNRHHTIVMLIHVPERINLKVFLLVLKVLVRVLVTQSFVSPHCSSNNTYFRYRRVKWRLLIFNFYRNHHALNYNFMLCLLSLFHSCTRTPCCLQHLYCNLKSLKVLVQVLIHLWVVVVLILDGLVLVSSLLTLPA